MRGISKKYVNDNRDLETAVSHVLSKIKGSDYKTRCNKTIPQGARVALSWEPTHQVCLRCQASKKIKL